MISVHFINLRMMYQLTFIICSSNFSFFTLLCIIIFFQIRSHAQKYFLKVQKSGTSEHLPPPRPKRKAAHPYPQKAPKNGRYIESLLFTSGLCLLYESWNNTGFYFCIYQLLLHPKSQGHCNLPLLLLTQHTFIAQIHHLCLEHQLLVCLCHLGTTMLNHQPVCHN